ncbi:hypothetical protein PCANC_26668 [Puccinia coronata f. sp. avenae]|uniref:Retroviral polymerase SH3-like domain-containing protein n=1 Tax=Puccinia coronata f. sp. avenae TaxID=200324 RepID=A0A2N5TTX9_9BASI|nr:hypothetical protein PCANC_26668 [Puccinia coronata f. sp. avenae]
MNRRKGWKFDPKGEEGLLVGFNVALRSYRIVTKSRKVVKSKHVCFLKQPEEGTLNSDDGIEFNQLEDSVTPQDQEERKETSQEPQPSNHREMETDSDQEASQDSEAKIENLLRPDSDLSPTQETSNNSQTPQPQIGRRFRQQSR